MRRILGWAAGALAAFLLYAGPAAAQVTNYVVNMCPNNTTGVMQVCNGTTDPGIPTSGTSGGTFNTSPLGVTSTQTAFTIATGSTFQSIAAASGTRKGCLIQNTSTHTLYVFFGATGTASTSNSFQVAAGGSMSCLSGVVVLQDNIAVTTTTTSDTGVVNVN